MESSFRRPRRLIIFHLLPYAIPVDQEIVARLTTGGTDFGVDRMCPSARRRSLRAKTCPA